MRLIGRRLQEAEVVEGQGRGSSGVGIDLKEIELSPRPARPGLGQNRQQRVRMKAVIRVKLQQHRAPFEDGKILTGLKSLQPENSLQALNAGDDIPHQQIEPQPPQTATQVCGTNRR